VATSFVKADAYGIRVRRCNFYRDKPCQSLNAAFHCLLHAIYLTRKPLLNPAKSEPRKSPVTTSNNPPPHQSNTLLFNTVAFF